LANLVGVTLLGLGLVVSVATGRAVLGLILTVLFTTPKPQPPVA
jgi:hypothetical protein